MAFFYDLPAGTYTFYASESVAGYYKNVGRVEVSVSPGSPVPVTFASSSKVYFPVGPGVSVLCVLGDTSSVDYLPLIPAGTALTAVTSSTFEKSDIRDEVTYTSLFTTAGEILLNGLVFYQTPTGRVSIFGDYIYWDSGNLIFTDGTTTLSHPLVFETDSTAYDLSFAWGEGTFEIRVDGEAVKSGVWDGSFAVPPLVSLPTPGANNLLCFKELIVKRATGATTSVGSFSNDEFSQEFF